MKPNWEDAPEWAQWLAQDANGQWYWYSTRPIRHKGAWFNGHDLSRFAGDWMRNKKWYDTLERRPE